MNDILRVKDQAWVLSGDSLQMSLSFSDFKQILTLSPFKNDLVWFLLSVTNRNNNRKTDSKIIKPNGDNKEIRKPIRKI